MAALQIYKPSAIDFGHNWSMQKSPSPDNLFNAFSGTLSQFDGQIAGHKAGIRAGEVQLGFLKDSTHPDRLLKPALQGKRGERETNFYRAVFEQSDEKDRQFRTLVPMYYGSRCMNIQGTSHELMELEDVTHGFSQPATIDIKVGRRTYGPDASPDKIAKELVKCPQQAEIGFRILGYKVNDPSHPIRSRDRAWGFTLQQGDIQGALAEFFSVRCPSESREILHLVLSRLQSIKSAMQSGVYHFASSSILICYEADKTRAPHVEVRMIDFSHVFEGNGQPDDNYLYGALELEKHLTAIYRDMASHA